MVPPTSDDLKVALAQQVHFTLLQIEINNGVLLGVYYFRNKNGCVAGISRYFGPVGGTLLM